MVYGDFLTPEVAEDHQLEPKGIYGALKLAGEKLVIAYNQVFGMEYTNIRPSALYGPGCVSRRVSQIFIENALVGDKLRVDGVGEEKIDFSWIDDVVDGVVRVVAHPGARNQSLNITTGGARPLRGPDRDRPGALPGGRSGVRRARRAAPVPRHAGHRRGPAS